MITTETGAKKIEDSDNWREIFDAHNESVDALNSNIAKLREGVAIVVDGDTAAIAVPVGGYAWVRNNTHGLSEGVYKNTSSSAFPVSGGTANNTIFTPVYNGTANDLNNRISKSTLNSANLIDILSHDSSNPYIVPEDGYVRITGGYLAVGDTTIVTNVSGQQSGLFVRKGGRIYVGGNATQAQFVPFT